MLGLAVKIATVFSLLTNEGREKVLIFDSSTYDRGRRNGESPLYEDVREKIRASEGVHADGTSWRNDGVGHYVWFAGNEDLAFFHIDRHRSAHAARTVFGEDFAGFLVRDRYAAYNGSALSGKHVWLTSSPMQKRSAGNTRFCRPGIRTRPLFFFCDQLIDLCARACDTSRKLKSGEVPWEKAASNEKRFIRELGKICKKPFRFNPAQSLRKFLIGPEQKHLTTFLCIPGVAPTNNHAEQTLRKMVIFRKICFGTRSDAGLKTHSIMQTLVKTARRQGVHPREFLHILHTADTATAQAALYINSS
jgi:hypothetical protein